MTRPFRPADFGPRTVAEGRCLTRLAPSFAPVETAADDRTLRFIFSTGGVDRYGDVIDPNGWQLANFNTNPVVLWAHDASAPPIGRAKNVGVVGGKLMGSIEFMSADVNPMSDAIYQMLRAGFLNAVSVGFSPIAWKQTTDKARPGGIDFSKVELLEVSIVPIPALPTALVQARAAGIETRIFADWAARQLTKEDSSTMSRASLNIIHREFGSPPATRGARPFAEPKARSTGGFESLGHFARALIVAGRDRAKIDDRLVRAGPSRANEIDPTSGGFLIPDAFSDLLIGSLWEQSVIGPLVDRRETSRPENMALPGVDETSRATGSRWGGVESYFEGEGVEPTTTLPKIRQIKFMANKLIGIVIASEELLRDVPLLSSHLLRAYGAEAGRSLIEQSWSGTA
jgi:HK97 family phage prohead protease